MVKFKKDSYSCTIGGGAFFCIHPVKGPVIDSVSEAMKHKKLNYLNEPTIATAFKVKLPELLSCVTANQRVCPEGAL